MTEILDLFQPGLFVLINIINAASGELLILVLTYVYLISLLMSRKSRQFNSDKIGKMIDFHHLKIIEILHWDLPCLIHYICRKIFMTEHSFFQHNR